VSMIPSPERNRRCAATTIWNHLCGVSEWNVLIC
jgi:hypothetical protein